MMDVVDPKGQPNMDFVPSFCRNFVKVSPEGTCVIDGSGLCQIEDCLIVSLDQFVKMSPGELRQLQEQANSSRRA